MYITRGQKEIMEYLCIDLETYKVDWDALCKKIPVFEILKSLKSKPKWHAEESVFVHTQMAYEWLRENRTVYQPGLVFPAVLLHDIGKALCAVDPDGYLLSSGHEKYSAQLAKEILYGFEPFVVQDIVTLVEHHDLRYQYKTMKPSKIRALVSKFKNTFSWSNFWIDLFVPVFEADCNGAIRDVEYSYEEDLNELGAYFHEPFMVVMFGLPGSGKNHFIENILPHLTEFRDYEDFEVLSRDDIRAELGMAGFEDYKNIDEEEVSKIFKTRLNKALETRKNIVINNTNLKRQYRSEFMNLAKSHGYQYRTIGIIRPLEKLYEVRPKAEWESVITRMMRSMEYPLQDENFEYYDEYTIDYLKRCIKNDGLGI